MASDQDDGVEDGVDAAHDVPSPCEPTGSDPEPPPSGADGATRTARNSVVAPTPVASAILRSIAARVSSHSTFEPIERIPIRSGATPRPVPSPSSW